MPKKTAGFVVLFTIAFVPACVDAGHVHEERMASLALVRGERLEARRILHQHDATIAVPTTLTLADAVRIATLNNRDYEFQRETIYLDALGLEVTRHSFKDPIFAAQLSYFISGTRPGPSFNTGAASVGASQMLPTGGSIGASGQASVSEASSGFPNPTSSVSGGAQITQPLLRGIAPYAFEPLTQAERDTLYAARDFELFRQKFAIDVLTSYYGLVSEKQHVQNARESMEALEFVAKKARAFFDVDRTTKIDMLRAEQAFLTAKNGLIDEEETYKLAIDRFKVFLGVPTSVEFGIPDHAEPDFVPVEMDIETAVETALERRLDLLTAQDRVEDAERQVSVAGNALLPSLTASASYTISSDAGLRASELTFRNDAYQAGLTLAIPLERTSERRNYRAALVGVDQARRALELAEANTVVEVRDSLRSLRSQDDKIKIQGEIIKTESARVKYAEIRYQAGEIDSRDLTEANQNLLAAENSLIDGIVAYEISRLTLLKELGKLVVTEEGAIGQ